MAKDVDLNFIASQNERLLAEVAAMRHDSAVLMAAASPSRDEEQATRRCSG
jgi:hypothetical protein